jgi:hypothetical protein
MPLALPNPLRTKKRQLTDIRVSAIALVDKGANRRPFFLFKRDENPQGDNMDRPIIAAKAAIAKASSLQDVIAECIKVLQGQPDDTELKSVVDMLTAAATQFPKPEPAADGSFPYPYPMSKSENGKHVLDLTKVIDHIEKGAATLKPHNKTALENATKVIKSALVNEDEKPLEGEAAASTVADLIKKAVASPSTEAALKGE